MKQVTNIKPPKPESKPDSAWEYFANSENLDDVLALTEKSGEYFHGYLLLIKQEHPLISPTDAYNMLFSDLLVISF